MDDIPYAVLCRGKTSTSALDQCFLQSVSSSTTHTLKLNA